MSDEAKTVPAEVKPETKGVLDWFHTFNITEVDAITAVFTPPFKVSEIWDALKAAASLGQKAEAYIDSLGGLSLKAHVGAHSITPEEVCAQIKAHIKPAAGADPSAPKADVAADGTAKMDPVLAGLIINLVTMIAQRLLSRFGK